MLRILNVAFPLAPVGPDAVGGAEQVLWMLHRGLTASGHRSTLIACEAVPSDINDAVREEFRRRCREQIEEVLRRETIDVVHLHGVDFYEYLPRTDVPLLATIHLPPSWYAPHLWEMPRERPNLFFNFVSASQKESSGLSCDISVIENGVFPVSTGCLSPRRHFAISLGRICPEKNFQAAIRAARLAGVHFILAGSVFGYEAHRRYFSEQIEPLLGPGTRFIGPARGIRKWKLLSAALCVLIPSLAAETSSLVAMEALSCGTPVVAYPSGELKNIVEHGKTGFLVGNESEMADAIIACETIDPEMCRRRAQERFSAQRMVNQYFELYERLVTCASKKSARLIVS